MESVTVSRRMAADRPVGTRVGAVTKDGVHCVVRTSGRSRRWTRRGRRGRLIACQSDEAELYNSPRGDYGRYRRSNEHGRRKLLRRPSRESRRDRTTAFLYSQALGMSFPRYSDSPKRRTCRYARHRWQSGPCACSSRSRVGMGPHWRVPVAHLRTVRARTDGASPRA
jgi:hypothetical protein